MTHTFNVGIAEKYGVNAAIILQHIGFWCTWSKANEAHYHDGYYWTYNTNNALCALFPYMTGKAIRSAIQKLVDDGIIIKGNYNEKPFDRTLWYAMTAKGEALFDGIQIEPVRESDDCQKGQFDMPKMANVNFPKGQFSTAQKGRPIPNIIPVKNNIDIDNARAHAREEEVNPYGETDYRPPIGTVQQYAVQSFTVLGARAMEELNSFVDDLGEEIVRHAIDNTLDKGVTNWGYCKSILNGYAQAGVKTLAQAKAHDEKFKESKGKNARSGKQEPQKQQQQEKAWEDMTAEERENALKHGPFGRFY